MHSKSQVNAAGLVIRDHKSLADPGMDEALNVLGEWRSCQAYPLQVAYMKLRERARRVDANTTVSQRLKRVPSIITKLQRNPNMKLSTIQDIGGCRAVVEDIPAVEKLMALYGAPIRDYIQHPKSDGYRSVHFIDQYEPSDSKYEQLSGKKTEVQVRTRLQHAWATAVETVDSILGQRLKTGGGDADWKRFFALASGYIAHKENRPCVPNTPENIEELKTDLKRFAEELKVFVKLDTMSSSVQVMNTLGPATHRLGKRKIEEYILVLDVEKREILPHPFTNAMLPQIADRYLQLEKENFGNPNIQVVQVKVETARALKKAYPNYYLSAQEFLRVVREVL